MFRHVLRSLFAILAVAAVFAVMTADADARSRGSFGSRGTRTFSAPSPTATAPKSVQPIERTMTKPAQPSTATAARPGAAPSATGGFFNRPGVLGGLAAGFLGAGLFGLLFGHGLMGGLGGIASIFGLLLQLGIVALVAMLVWRWWQGRSQPATAYAGGSAMRQDPRGQDPRQDPREDGRSNMSFLRGLGGASQAPAEAPVEIKQQDFETFERLLGEVQNAYGAEDLNTLRPRVTPEMLSYYAEEMAQNTSNGDINQISDVKLLQGDLAESWSEGDDEYATVAMRYSLNDRIVDRSNGKLIEQLPSEVTELWTFRRGRGGNWILSAVQQADGAGAAAA